MTGEAESRGRAPGPQPDPLTLSLLTQTIVSLKPKSLLIQHWSLWGLKISVNHIHFIHYSEWTLATDKDKIKVSFSLVFPLSSDNFGDCHLHVLGWDPCLIIKKKKFSHCAVRIENHWNNLMPQNSSKLWIQVNDQLQTYDFEDNQYILCHFYLFIYYQIKFLLEYTWFINVSFKYTAKWIGYTYKYIHSFYPLFSHIDNSRILSRPSCYTVSHN